MDVEFSGGWNQEEGKDPGLVSSRTYCVISYANCPIIWASQIHTEIVIITMEDEYISLSQVMRYVLTFVSLMKEIEIVIKLQVDIPKVLCSIFEKPLTPVKVYEDNQI